MAVELAKLSLWLHTFTVGAPLSFLDHHLRCGDSLFGCWIDRAMAKAEEQGGSLFIRAPLRKALAAADPMQRLEALADAEIAEAEQSAALFQEVDDRTAPLARFLSVLHAFDWLNPVRQDAAAVGAWLGGAFGDPLEAPAQCAFFLQDVAELEERRFVLTPDDFRAVNPNTRTAPVFRTRRDARITTAIYRRLPVLANHSAAQSRTHWPLKYRRMFDMTNDSGLFRTRKELDEQEGAWPIGGNVFDSPSGRWLPLYEGKMVQAFDHRAADVRVNLANPHRPAQAVATTDEQHADPAHSSTPQYWVPASKCDWPADVAWLLGFKEITAPTNARTFIAALLPAVGFGNKVPIWAPLQPTRQRQEWLLAANFNATIFDFVTRQKVQGQTLNLFIVEQLPVVPPTRYAEVRFGAKTAAEVVRDAVLELTYTADDMAPFAEELGHVDANGNVQPPFRWDAERRLRLRAKLDAVYFHLCGVTDRDDVAYIYSTFPIVERHEEAAWGSYRSRDLGLAWMNALAAGRPDADVD